jgi:hypothetical protein
MTYAVGSVRGSLEGLQPSKYFRFLLVVADFASSREQKIRKKILGRRCLPKTPPSCNLCQITEESHKR